MLLAGTELDPMLMEIMQALVLSLVPYGCSAGGMPLPLGQPDPELMVTDRVAKWMDG